MKKVIKILIPLLCTAGMLWWMLSKVDFSQIEHILRHGVDYWVLLAVMGVVTLSHVIRGFRWGYQLRAAGVGDIPAMTLCTSIFGAYALNLVVPYLGEGWRILYISRRQKAKVSTVLGTDLGDRISDAVVVMLLLVLALIVGHSYIVAFMRHYAVGEKLLALLSDAWLWGGVAMLIVVVATALYTLRHTARVQRLMKWIGSVWQGFAVLFTMKGRGMYLLLTVGIWTCYFMETYLSFYAFPYTRELVHTHGLAFGLLPGLISFVFSSLSMAIPSNGGLGPWNIAVMFALSLFGVAQADAAAFSIMVWSTVTLTLILLGIFTAIYASRRNF